MHRIVIATLLLCLVPAAHAGDGLITKKSHYNASQTLDRLEALLRDKGLTVFARVDHAGGAEKVGIPLRPTALLIFGNPKLGSHLFTSRQSAGIDLPMKALAWEDGKGNVWLTYNDPQYIADRHRIRNRAEVIGKMTKALDTLTDKATQP